MKSSFITITFIFLQTKVIIKGIGDRILSLFNYTRLPRDYTICITSEWKDPIRLVTYLKVTEPPIRGKIKIKQKGNNNG